MLQSDLYYAARFAQSGLVLTFLGIYLRGYCAFTIVEIGGIYAIYMMAMMVGSGVITFVADATTGHKWIALVSYTIGSLTVLCFAVFDQPTFRGAAAIVAVGNFFLGGFNPLMDNAVQTLCVTNGIVWGESRRWGCVGWGVAVLTTSLIADIDNLHRIWYVYAFLTPWPFFLAVGLMSAFVSVSTATASDGGTATSGGDAVATATVRWFCQGPVATVAIITFFMGALFASMNVYVYIWAVYSLNASFLVVGISTVLLTACEFPIFTYGTTVVDAIGLAGVMYLSALSYGIRLLSYAYLVYNPWWVVALEPLHALGFSLPIGALMGYIAKSATEARAPKATARGINQAMLNLGRSVGFLWGGWLYQYRSPRSMFEVMAFTMLPCMVLTIAVFQVAVQVELQNRTGAKEGTEPLLPMTENSTAGADG